MEICFGAPYKAQKKDLSRWSGPFNELHTIISYYLS